MSVFPLSIQTPRLHLRQFKHNDWPSLHEHYSDPECTKFTFRRALTEGESWRAMSSMLGHWTIRGYGPFAAVEISTGKVIGAIGLWYPNDWPEPEIKWAAFLHFGMKAPISFINSENEASLRLAQAVGAKHEKTLDFRGSPWQIYRHPSNALPIAQAER